MTTNNATNATNFPPGTVAQGFTGATTLTNHGVLIGQATSPIAATSAGTAGQVLMSNGASADPTFTSAGAMVLLSSQSASSSSSIDFTSVISASYSTYYLKIRRYVPATNSTDINVLFSTNNGSTYLGSNYKWSYFIQQSGGSTFASGSNAAAVGFVTDGISNSSSQGADVNIIFYNLNSGTYPPRAFASTVYNYSAGDAVQVQTTFMNTGVTAVNAIRVVSSSGNIASGNFYFYGVVEP